MRRKSLHASPFVKDPETREPMVLLPDEHGMVDNAVGYVDDNFVHRRSRNRQQAAVPLKLEAAVYAHPQSQLPFGVVAHNSANDIEKLIQCSKMFSSLRNADHLNHTANGLKDSRSLMHSSIKNQLRIRFDLGHRQEWVEMMLDNWLGRMEHHLTWMFERAFYRTRCTSYTCVVPSELNLDLVLSRLDSIGKKRTVIDGSNCEGYVICQCDVHWSHAYYDYIQRDRPSHHAENTPW